MAGVNAASLTQYNKQLLQSYNNTSGLTNQQGQTTSLLQSSLSQSVGQQRQTATTNAQQTTTPNDSKEVAQESVKVSASIGKAAAKGQLTKAEAMAIYEKIASFL